MTLQEENEKLRGLLRGSIGQIDLRIEADIQAALSQQPEPAECPVCCSDEPHTGTCGSSDPRALCNRAKVEPAPAKDEQIGLVEALSQIERWDGFPHTGKVWSESGEPMSYGACFGSNGERDFMRSLAAKTLAAYRAALSSQEK